MNQEQSDKIMVSRRGVKIWIYPPSDIFQIVEISEDEATKNIVEEAAQLYRDVCAACSHSHKQ